MSNCNAGKTFAYEANSSPKGTCALRSHVSFHMGLFSEGG